MELKMATAGTMESGDIMIQLAPSDHPGLDIHLQSSVAFQFGDQIREVIRETLMGLGIIIGTGIFVLTGIGAAKYAGPGLMLSFVFAAITCAFVCLAYSELASFLPVSGSSYTYAYACLL